MMPSWSSEICSSNAETSMPRLSTPRIVPTPSVMFLPGMKAPGGTNTPFMPARALGAPHTTCTGSPSPVLTMHTRRRSAFGCCSAEITDAIVNGASSFSRSVTLSTSSPIIVSLSTMAASGCSVSRCSLSQARVNFMILRTRAVPSPACGEWSEGGHVRWRRSRSCTQSASERREVERTEAVMREPAHVGLEEGAQVRHPVFQHGDAVDSHAPGEALIFVGIEAAIAQHVRMHHSTAENLQPVVALAEPDLALVAPALDVDLKRGFGEREERRAEAHLDLIDLEECLAELLQNPLQVTEMRGLVDDQSFDLVEHGSVCLVAVAAIGPAGNDDADRRLRRQHGPDLHRRGMGAQEQPRTVRLRIEIERVVHFASRMALGKVELGEIVVVGLDVGAFGDRKPHVGEDRGQLIHDLGYGMEPTGLGGRFAHRQRDVHGFGVEPLIQRQLLQGVPAGREGSGDTVLDAVDGSPLLLSLVRRHCAERFQER